jgi:hypothetical protein
LSDHHLFSSPLVVHFVHDKRFRHLCVTVSLLKQVRRRNL